ncbi:hypothetical protein LX36DRAFT_708511 [Colletotrichum falcatum]|nr:hypothetical protein LX36DRAFT_708511 [Colletotrichum falcatum]
MQTKFILAALGAATVAVASPVPSVGEHYVCNDLLNKIIKGLDAAISDTALANSGSPPANAITLLQGAKAIVDGTWETRNKATLGLKDSEVKTTTATIDSVVQMLNSSDPTSALALADVTTVESLFEQIPIDCEIDDK